MPLKTLRHLDHTHGNVYISCLAHNGPDFLALTLANKAHNETIGLLDYLPLHQKLIYLVWALLIETREVFGIFQLLRFLPIEGRLSYKKWQASMQGRWQGWENWKRS